MKIELGEKFEKLGITLCIMSLLDLGLYFLNKDGRFFIIAGVLLSLGVALWVVS